MECPRDHSVLESGVYEGDVEVDVCPSCAGMWLDMGELERIEDMREHDYCEELKRMPNVVGAAYEMARQKNVAPISCPKCGAEMSRHEYAFCSQIMIDVCPKSEGIWLDKGEIEKLEVFFEQSRMEAGQIRKGFWKSRVSPGLMSSGKRTIRRDLCWWKFIARRTIRRGIRRRPTMLSGGIPSPI